MSFGIYDFQRFCGDCPLSGQIAGWRTRFFRPILDEDRHINISRTTDAVVARVEGTLIYAVPTWQRAAAAQGLIGTIANSRPVIRFSRDRRDLSIKRLLALDARRASVGPSKRGRKRRWLAAARRTYSWQSSGLKPIWRNCE